MDDEPTRRDLFVAAALSGLVTPVGRARSASHRLAIINEAIAFADETIAALDQSADAPDDAPPYAGRRPGKED